MKIIRYIIKLILLALVIATALFTTVTAWLTQYSPEDIGSVCLVWFTFPYVWLLLLAMLVVCSFTRHWFVCACCIASLAYSTPEALREINLPLPEQKAPDGDGGGTKLLSYNICTLLTVNPAFPEHRVDSMVVDILGAKADILCLQEAPPDWMMRSCRVADPFKEVFNSFSHKSLHGNVCTLTNLPAKDVTDPKELGLEGVAPEAFLATDITLGNGQRVRVFNCHLASIKLSHDQIDAVSSKKNVNKQRINTLKGTYEHLMRAFKTRAVEVRMLTRAIEASPHPVVICGDFNDTPVSYTFHTINSTRPRGDSTSSLSEARHTRRFGLAKTYRGKLPPLRIDYIIKSGRVTTWGYKEHDWAWSDHKAVSAWLTVKQ